MKISIMQPYFLPYAGYFSLIKHTDRFILFDTVQFIRHGWIERNRILKPVAGWQYVKVPLIKFPRDTKIQDVRINKGQDWKHKILAQVQHYKKTAPYYFSILKLLHEILEQDYFSIVKLNQAVLIKTCQYLGFEKKIEVFSEMNVQIEEVHEPDEWALNICRSLGNVTEYWNPSGGQSFFNRKKYMLGNITLKFHTMKLDEYDQKRETFESGLSIIDVMMFNSVKDINKMLDNYELS